MALLTPAFWPEVRRGTERMARELADALRARGHEPVIVTAHPGRRRAAEEDGVLVVRVRRPPARRAWEPHLLHVPLVRRELRRLRPDVAHALYPSDALAAPPGVPVVLSILGLPLRQWVVARHGRAFAVRRALRRASVVTVLSRAAASAAARDLGVVAEVVPAPVDLDAFRPGPGRASVPTVLCPADHGEPRKRVADVVAALPPSTRLILSRHPRHPAPSGPGVEVRDLDDRAALAAAYREAWATVLASEGEAFGLVAAESLACGTPVVVRDDAALPELVTDPRLGTTFRDAPDLTRLAAPGPGVVAACRARAEAFAAGPVAARFEELYERARRG